MLVGDLEEHERDRLFMELMESEGGLLLEDLSSELSPEHEYELLWRTTRDMLRERCFPSSSENSPEEESEESEESEEPEELDELDEELDKEPDELSELESDIEVILLLALEELIAMEEVEEDEG